MLSCRSKYDLPFLVIAISEEWKLIQLTDIRLRAP